jgi:hypothetical protein
LHSQTGLSQTDNQRQVFTFIKLIGNFRAQVGRKGTGILDLDLFPE